MTYSVTLNENQISDLFFNHQNEHYSALFGEDAPDIGIMAGDSPIIREAVRKDAEEFVKTIGFDRDNNKWVIEAFVKWLTDDFMNRL